MTSSDTHDEYDYDLVVIGGGSGGLAAAKEASKLGARVACFDFVKPSPAGTTWGLGGTCVNVGCIPKKLMHYSGLLHRGMTDAKMFGWTFSTPKLDWAEQVENITNYIRSMSFKYRVALRSEGVEYVNAYATFVDDHTVEYELKGETKRMTAARFLVVVGGRPTMPGVEGIEHAISSDDIFWKETAPGKTLVVGASYIALECAGFLTEQGFDTTVMVRSIFLRGFDQQVAEILGDIMARTGTKIIRPAVPDKLEKLEDNRIKVTYTNSETGETAEDVFDTVLYATGRHAVVDGMNIESTGVLMHERSRKIITDDNDCTNVPHIFSIGDCAHDRPELTPVAIKAGKLLAQRLYGGGTKLMDYDMVPTTVYTPYEYGCCGYSQEKAEKKFGAENIDTYLSRFGTTEIAASHRVDHNDEDFIKPCFAKLVVDKSQNEKVVGFHVVGPEAGEITQGFALAVRVGATKADFDDMVGIHPTTAEELTELSVTGSSGLPFEKAGGC